MKTCAAKGCARRIPEHMLMCRAHWFQVPTAIRSRVLRLYTKSKEGDTIAKGMHLSACRDAVKAVADAEGGKA